MKKLLVAAVLAMPAGEAFSDSIEIIEQEFIDYSWRPCAEQMHRERVEFWHLDFDFFVDLTLDQVKQNSEAQKLPGELLGLDFEERQVVYKIVLRSCVKPG